jgi:hypothetical protein
MTTTNNKHNHSERGYTLYASFIPIVLIILIIVGAGYFLLKGEFQMPKLGKDMAEVRRIEGFPTVAYTNGQLDKQRVVIKSTEELNEFLDMVDSTGQLIVLENINFEKEFLIGAATETNETSGYEMKIKKLIADKERKLLTVSLQETRPGDTCEVDIQNNVAVDIVAISKTDWEINFERVTKTDECQ